MVKKQQIQNSQQLPAQSALQRFTLSFEYDRTIQDIKRDVRVRTI